MSACISRQGEFSEHVTPASGSAADRFTCARCFVTDEAAWLVALDSAERELDWWRREFATRFEPDSLPQVGTALYGSRLLVVDAETGAVIDAHGRRRPR